MTATDLIDDRQIEALRSALARNERITAGLPGGGHVDIDRQQPFLCVYRYPAERSDIGTDKLLPGGASYLLIPGSDRHAGWTGKLMTELAAELADSFGAAMVLEIWSAENAGDAVDGRALGTPRFRILSPAAGSPVRTLETLERAILAGHWPGGRPELDVEYADHTGPANMPPLLGTDRPPVKAITTLGLELAPVYRDPDHDRIFPEVLRTFRAELWHVLREAFFTFSHTRATYRPSHYHELGPQAMTSLVTEVDRSLAAVSDSYDLLLHVTPVNTEQAWGEFRAGGFRCKPAFYYRALHTDPGELKRTLYTIPVDDIEDPALHNLFAMKRDEVDRQITMLGDRESSRFMLESLQIYGRAARNLKETAVSILERVVEPGTAQQHMLGAEEFAAAARKELDHYRKQDNRLTSGVTVSDTVPGIMVSKGKLLIGANASVAAGRVEATLHHEIGTHVLTYHNGLTQPFRQLHAGLAGYEELQEGLAVFSEYLVGGLSARRMRVLAARVLAVESVADGADFTETYSMLTNEYGFEPATAYSITMRVHRSGGFAKDVIYLRGLARLLEYLAGGGDHAELLVGKVSLAQIDVIRELTWRRILGPGRLLPRYLDHPAARERLQRARQGLSVADLLDG